MKKAREVDINLLSNIRHLRREGSNAVLVEIS